MLIAETLNKDATTLTLSTYKSYQRFFQEIVEDNSQKEDEIILTYIKLVDGVLWSFGRFFKGNDPIEVSRQNAISKITFTPDQAFKERVFDLLDRGTTQGRAMRIAAEERDVQLPDSYYSYPSSHVNRWRNQS